MSTWNPGGEPPPEPSGDQPPNYGQQPPSYGAPPPPPPPAYGQPPPAYGQPPGYGAPPPPPPSQPYGGYPAAPPPPPNPYGYQPTGYAPVAAAAAQLVELPNVGVVKIATIGQRFLARLVDSAIYLVVAIILFAIGLGSIAASSHRTCDASGFCYTTTSSAGIGGFLLSMALLFAFAFLYEWLFIAYKGQTLGKMALGVKVLRQEDGQIPGLGKAFIREIIPWGASMICSLLGILMYVSVFFDNSGRNQTWYDKAATTQVISLK